MFGVFFSFAAAHMLYLALHLETSSFPRPLTPRQEVEAFAAFRQGDLEARDRIIRHNLRLVAHIVKKYYAAPGEQEDLISIGTIGLIKAVNSFDSEKQARFSTYASKCIENAILSWVRVGVEEKYRAAGRIRLVRIGSRAGGYAHSFRASFT